MGGLRVEAPTPDVKRTVGAPIGSGSIVVTKTQRTTPPAVQQQQAVVEKQQQQDDTANSTFAWDLSSEDSMDGGEESF